MYTDTNKYVFDYDLFKRKRITAKAIRKKKQKIFCIFVKIKMKGGGGMRS